MIPAPRHAWLPLVVLLAACSGTEEEEPIARGDRAEKSSEAMEDTAQAGTSAAGEEQAAPAEGDATPDQPVPREPAVPIDEQPGAVRVQHILIGFQDAAGFQGRETPEGAAGRSEEEARALAARLLAQIREGADFAALVVEHTDDQAPGIYGMTNAGAEEREGYSPRGRMVSAFGDVAFSLEVGEIGMAPYDPASSPYGWHIIKRLE